MCERYYNRYLKSVGSGICFNEREPHGKRLIKRDVELEKKVPVNGRENLISTHHYPNHLSDEYIVYDRIRKNASRECTPHQVTP